MYFFFFVKTEGEEKIFRNSYRRTFTGAPRMTVNFRSAVLTTVEHYIRQYYYYISVRVFEIQKGFYRAVTGGVAVVCLPEVNGCLAGKYVSW